MKRRTKSLTKNVAKMKLAFEDMKRCLDSNVEAEDKVHMIERILENLYV